MALFTANLEDGRPTVETARQRMYTALRQARAQRVPAVKLIHGYGSTGQGGRIRTMVRRELEQLKIQGKIKDYVAGEEFSPFDAAGQRAIAADFRLTKDSDYTRCNHGITVVIL